MKNRRVVSPEIASGINGQRALIKRVLDYYISPLMARCRSFILRQKWRKHADSRVFFWDWRTINYNRIALVNLLLQRFDNPNYLEIGCASNSLFDSVPVANKLGVDPFSGGNRRLTSDEFFASNKTQFDVVFIDGLHTYEQVRLDVINALSCLKLGGWIALHDMLPRSWIEHHIPIVTHGAWTGDVWKVAFELAQTPGLEFKILEIDHGVGVVKVLDPNPKLKDMTAQLHDQEFSYFYDNIKKVPLSTWESAQDWLRN